MNVKAHVKKTRGRKRRVAGWVLVVVGVLQAAIVAASAWGHGHVVIGGGWGVRAQPGMGRAAIGINNGSAFYHVIGTASWVAGPQTYRNADLSVRLVWWTPRVDRGPGSTSWGAWVVSYMDGNTSGGGFMVRWVVWPWSLAATGCGVWLVRRGKRAARDSAVVACGRCGYDLAGLATEAVCPECGAERGTK